MGVEVDIVPALPRALRGAQVDLSICGAELRRDAITADSDNLLQLAAALALAHAYNIGDTPEINFWCDWWMRRLAWERTNWMGHEVCGRTYPSWHFMGKRVALDIARRLGRVDLAAELLEWMLAFLALAALASGRRPGRYITDHRIAEAGVIQGTGDEVTWSGRYCAWSGDRADSRDPKQDGRWHGWLAISSPTIWLDLALGLPSGETDERRVENACAYPMLPPSEIALLKGILGGNWGAGLAYLSGHRPNVPIRVVQCDEGVWTLSPVGRPSSTPHAYAVAQWHHDGRVAGLYADPGWRDAGGDFDWIVSGSAAADSDGLAATATRSDLKYGSPHTLTLPGGARSLDFTWGPDGVTSASHPTEPGAPPPPAPVEPTPPPSSGGALEVVRMEDGRTLVLWRGTAEVLGWPADDGRTMVILS